LLHLDEKHGSIFGIFKTSVHLKELVMKILIGTLAGLVAGVAIGMLLAPVSGSETRSNIANGTKNRWRKIWGKADLDEDPWAEYNERKAAAAQNATA
jgi:gas vesicle protein